MAARRPEDIHALIADAFNRGDLDAFVDAHEERAVTLDPAGARAIGRVEIRAAMEPVFALRPMVVNEVLETLENGELALTQARWRLRGTGPGGEAVELEGEAAVVSRRQPDGTWRIVMENPVRPA